MCTANRSRPPKQPGTASTIAWQSTMRAKASVRMGEIRRAEAEARLALRVFEEGSGEPGVAWCVAHLLDALLARGALDEAAELVDRHLVGASAAPTLPVALLRTSLAHFHLAEGGRPALQEARPPVGSCPQRSPTHTAATGARPLRWRSRRSTVRRGARRRPRKSSPTRDDSASRGRGSVAANPRFGDRRNGWHTGAPGLGRGTRACRGADSSMRARCSSWGPRCDAPGYEPRRVTCCVRRSTKRLASEPVV